MSNLACDREFSVLGTECRVVVEWMTPVRYRGDWRCDWVIHWPGRDPESRYSVGVDSAQAILLAMAMVRATMELSDHDVVWLDGSDDLGLPSMPRHPDDEANS